MSSTADPAIPLDVPRRARVQSLLFVLASAAALFVISGLLRGWEWAAGLAVLALFTATVLGKLAVFVSLAQDVKILGVELPSFSPYTIGALICYLDSIVAILMAYNFDLMLKIPGIGGKIAAARSKGKVFLHDYRWFQRVAYIGIVAFVFFPISGTGAIAGSILGNMLGIARKTLVVLIMIGGAIGGFGFAAGADLFRQDFEALVKNPIVETLGLALLAIVAAIVVIKVRRLLRPARAHPNRQSP